MFESMYDDDYFPLAMQAGPRGQRRRKKGFPGDPAYESMFVSAGGDPELFAEMRGSPKTDDQPKRNPDSAPEVETTPKAGKAKRPGRVKPVLRTKDAIYGVGGMLLAQLLGGPKAASTFGQNYLSGKIAKADRDSEDRWDEWDRRRAEETFGTGQENEGSVAEGLGGLAKDGFQMGADNVQEITHHVAKIPAEYFRLVMPNGILHPKLEEGLRKHGLPGKIVAETVLALDPTQFPAFVEAITEQADANGDTGLAKMGRGLKDTLSKAMKGDEDAIAQITGTGIAFFLTLATTKSIRLGFKPRVGLPATLVDSNKKILNSVEGGRDLIKHLQNPPKLKEYAGDYSLFQRLSHQMIAAARQWPEFSKDIQRLAKGFKGKAKIASVKDMKRAAEKAYKDSRDFLKENERRRLAGEKPLKAPVDSDVERLGDIIRATVVVDEYPDWAALEAMMRKRYTVINAKNRVAKPQDSGYQDYAFVIELKGGVLAEIQFNVPEMIKAKDISTPYYEKARSATTAAERAKHDAIQREIFRRAREEMEMRRRTRTQKRR